MPIINKQYTVSLVDNNPAAIALNDLVHLDRELSQHYGKNVRQGNNFRVKGVQVAMRGANSGYDVGLASAVRFSYAPHTKHTNTAWRDAFKMWSQQRQLRGTGTGRTQYEDMEFSYSTSYLSELGTSHLMQGGLNDDDADKMVLYGSSSETGNVFSLEDHYQSMNPPVPVPRYAWNNSPVVEMKFDQDDLFPHERTFWATSQASTNASFETVSVESPIIEDPVISLTHLGGADMEAEMHLLPEPANVLCGLLELDVWVIPDDTVAQAEDEAILYVSIWVESWKPILSYFNRKKTAGKKFKRSFTRKSSRRSRSRR